MTLTAKNYVRRSQAANPFERHVVKRFREDLEAGDQTTEHGANLARAGALSIDCVVDQVNEQGLLQAVELPIESADVNSTAKYRGRRIDIITNLQFADPAPVFGRDGMYPAGFVAKH